MENTTDAVTRIETRDPGPAPRELIGTDGRDFLRGGEGNDLIAGGRGDDRLDGFAGDDTFVYKTGDGRDTISNFDLLGNDRVILNVDGINNLEDLLATASVTEMGNQAFVSFDFGNGDRLSMLTDSLEGLTEDDFLFNIDPTDAPPLEAAPSMSGTNSSAINLVVDSEDDIPADNNPGGFSGEIITITRPDQESPVEATDTDVESEAEAPAAPVVPAAGSPAAPASPTPPIANEDVSGENVSAEFITVSGADDVPAGNNPGGFSGEVITITESQLQPPVFDQELIGTDGRDFLRGGQGNDLIAGGGGRDTLDGGAGDDTFVFNEGDGRDRIRSFDLSGDDMIQLDVDGIDSFEDLLETASVRTFSSGDFVRFNFGDGDELSLLTDDFDNLTADDFIFV